MLYKKVFAKIEYNFFFQMMESLTITFIIYFLIQWFFFQMIIKNLLKYNTCCFKNLEDIYIYIVFWKFFMSS